MKTQPLKSLALFLVLVLSMFSVLELASVPRVMAIPTVSLDPISGHVLDLVTVTGTIDTENGTFTIRWDGTVNVTTGKAVGNEVTASFVVPQTTSSPSGRSVTVELIDNNATADNVGSTDFTLFTEFLLHVETPSPPGQLQEGATTSIKANVTGGVPNTVYVANITVRNPADQTHFAIVPLSNTTTTGSGGGAETYPTGFGASTNLTGTYFVAFNETIATTKFAVGLTDKTEYRRNEDVQVQAAGYKPSEVVRADLETGSLSVSGFPKNITAGSGGVVTFSWTVPANASRGTYCVSLTNTTSDGTVKTPSDAQDFNVTGVAFFVRAGNLAGDPVEGALIEVCNQSAPSVVVIKGNTNSTGWVLFNLESGNYTFKAFVKNVEVCKPSNQTITMETPSLLLQLGLIDFLATVETEAGEAVPLIDIALRFNYTTRENKIVTETATARTNLTGVAAIKHLFVNTTYQAEATRYGLLFSNTTINVEPLPSPPLITLNLTLPTYTLSVHALDAKDNDAAEVDLRVYEWTSGVSTPIESMETSVSGDAFFYLPFGRYILRAYKGEDFLSEAVVDLVEPLAFTFNILTLNVDVTVFVLDYFGQPIANADVRIERQIGQNFVLVASKTTSGAGSAQFTSMVGGDSRVSAYLNGKLVATKTQFLDARSNEIVFRVGEYVSLLGYSIATGAFALAVFIVILIAVGLIVARRRIVRIFRKQT